MAQEEQNPRVNFSRRLRWDLEANSLAEAVARFRAAGRPFLDLTVSNPTRVDLPYPEDWLDALRDPRALAYDPDPRGLRLAREAVAAYYASLGATVHPDRIILTASTSEAYSFLFKLLADPGDEILTPTPSYPLFEFLAGLEHLTTIDYPWDTPDFDRWISTRTRAAILVHPNNPTGRFWRRSQPLPESIPLIADEVFFDYALHPPPNACPSFAARSESLTFTLSGLSKICALPQMKLGWIVVSGPEPDARRAAEQLELIADTYLSASTPIQLAAATRWLPERHRIQAPLLERLLYNSRHTDPVEAGWTGLTSVTTPQSPHDAVALLEACGVLVHPGAFFGLQRTPCAVISLLTRPDIADEAAARLSRFRTATSPPSY